MMENNIEHIIDTFPEPFKTVVKKRYDIIFDYHSHNGKNDHDWLNEHGYSMKMCQDCTIAVEGLPNLSASSYGDWGSIYDDFGSYSKEERENGYNKSFNIFCKMYEEGIVELWRITLYINKFCYMYDDVKKSWSVNKYDGKHWNDCDSPL